MEKAKTAKTCYYELLEVERTATQKEIEKVIYTYLIHNLRATKKLHSDGILIRTRTKTPLRNSRTSVKHTQY